MKFFCGNLSRHKDDILDILVFAWTIFFGLSVGIMILSIWVIVMLS